MREYSKNELVEEFGSPSWVRANIFDKVQFLSGINIYDSILARNPREKHVYMLDRYPYGLVIELINGFSKIRTGIKDDHVNYIVIEPQEQIIEKKSKSVVGRALVGGLLLGPVGAVVGGMSGIGSKSVNLSDNPENILTICHNENGKDSFILFGVRNKHLKEVESFFKTNYAAKYKKSHEIVPSEITSQTGSLSVADEIRKLKELLDIGALTQNEFDEQKARILK